MEFTTLRLIDALVDFKLPIYFGCTRIGPGL